MGRYLMKFLWKNQTFLIDDINEIIDWMLSNNQSVHVDGHSLRAETHFELHTHKLMPWRWRLEVIDTVTGHHVTQRMTQSNSSFSRISWGILANEATVKYYDANFEVNNVLKSDVYLSIEDLIKDRLLLAKLNVHTNNVKEAILESMSRRSRTPVIYRNNYGNENPIQFRPNDTIEFDRGIVRMRDQTGQIFHSSGPDKLALKLNHRDVDFSHLFNENLISQPQPKEVRHNGSSNSKWRINLRKLFKRTG